MVEIRTARGRPCKPFTVNEYIFHFNLNTTLINHTLISTKIQKIHFGVIVSKNEPNFEISSRTIFLRLS